MKKLLVLLFVVLALSCVYAQNDWAYQETFPTTGDATKQIDVWVTQLKIAQITEWIPFLSEITVHNYGSQTAYFDWRWLIFNIFQWNTISNEQPSFTSDCYLPNEAWLIPWCNPYGTATCEDPITKKWGISPWEDCIIRTQFDSIRAGTYYVDYGIDADNWQRNRISGQYRILDQNPLNNRWNITNGYYNWACFRQTYLWSTYTGSASERNRYLLDNASGCFEWDQITVNPPVSNKSSTILQQKSVATGSFMISSGNRSSVWSSQSKRGDLWIQSIVIQQHPVMNKPMLVTIKVKNYGKTIEKLQWADMQFINNPLPANFASLSNQSKSGYLNLSIIKSTMSCVTKDKTGKIIKYNDIKPWAICVIRNTVLPMYNGIHTIVASITQPDDDFNYKNDTKTARIYVYKR